MASPSTSSAPAIPPKYEYLKSLCDIQTIRDLTEDAVRDILRNNTNDHGLEVVEMGQGDNSMGILEFDRTFGPLVGLLWAFC